MNKKILIVNTDFNDRLRDGAFPNLRIEGIDINNIVGIDLYAGKPVILCEEGAEQTFTLPAVLERRFDESSNKEIWVANADLEDQNGDIAYT